MRADARSFEFPAAFAAVVSTFDSLNHILTLNELGQVFSCVRKALREEGLFLFDLNMEEEFELNGRQSGFEIVEEDHACIVRSRYDAVTRLKSYEVTMFTLEGDDWRRGNLTLFQRYYTAAEVTECLQESGFERISVHDAQREFGLSVSAGRAFFVARRSNESTMD